MASKADGKFEHAADSVEVELSHPDPALHRRPGDRIRVLPTIYGLFPHTAHEIVRTLPDVDLLDVPEYRERGRLG